MLDEKFLSRHNSSPYTENKAPKPVGVTLMALMGLVPCVFHVMLLQISISIKRGVTIMALMGLAPCVFHVMLLHI